MTQRLTDYKVLTFDCYGTLIDWEGGIWDYAQALLMENDRNDIDRTTLLETYSRFESDQQAETPGKNYQELVTAMLWATGRPFPTPPMRCGV